jgi:hypothetical protein
MLIVKNELIKKFGLSDDEINLYGIDFLLQYLKFHKNRKLSVFLLGFRKKNLN